MLSGEKGGLSTGIVLAQKNMVTFQKKKSGVVDVPQEVLLYIIYIIYVSIYMSIYLHMHIPVIPKKITHPTQPSNRETPNVQNPVDLPLNPGCSIGILIMAYYNPHKNWVVKSIIPSIPKNNQSPGNWL